MVATGRRSLSSRRDNGNTPSALQGSNPSQRLKEGSVTSGRSQTWKATPKIIELLNISEYSHQVRMNQAELMTEALEPSAAGPATLLGYVGDGGSLKRGPRLDPAELPGLAKRPRRSQEQGGGGLPDLNTSNSVSDRSSLGGSGPTKSAAAALAAGHGGDESEDEEDILASKLAAVGREVKAASAAVLHDRMLFQCHGHAIYPTPTPHASKQVTCIVPVGEPIFQPLPHEVIFHGYEPYKTYEASLRLRNNDAVPRRIKVSAPESQFFSVRRASAPGKEEGSKVASGMEIVYTITFKPQSTDPYGCNLVVCTEREKFLVPVLATGVMPELDLPGAVDMGVSPTKINNRQTLLVRNVSSKATGFRLRTAPPFAVTPTEGFLEEGATVQVHLTFTPPTRGPYYADLELLYTSTGHTTCTALSGVGQDLPVCLSQDTVVLLPTYVTKMSQKTFKVCGCSGLNKVVLLPTYVTTMSQKTFKMGARYTKELMLSNTSDIPMRFSWRVPEDEQMSPREMQVLPQKGTILPHGKQRVSLEFVPHTVQKYTSHHLVLDIPKVADNQLSVAIRGECAVPRITLNNPVLEFGECYVRYPYKQSMRLSNPSKLPAKFEVVPQDEGSMGLATYTVEPSSGGVAAMGEQVIEVALTTHTLGRVQLPVRVRVVGSKGSPLEFPIDARSIGPHLLFGPAGASPSELGSATAVAFDKVEVLDTHTRMIQMHNPCWIAADCKLFIEGKHSAFSVEPREIHVQPGETLTAKVSVCMDDTRLFSDVLHALVFEGADVSIPLSATGTGNILLCEEVRGGVLECSHQFVGRPFQRDIVIHNLGRKPQQLTWTSQRLDDVRKEYAKSMRATGGILAPITRPLTMRNISKLPLSFSLRTGGPFSLDVSEVSLSPFEYATVNVTYDSNPTHDLTSVQSKQKLQITYSDNPQRDAVDLLGQSDFPNLILESTEVDFGSCLSDTTRRVPVRISNEGAVDVVYSWAWDPHSFKEDANSITSMNVKSNRMPKPPTVQLFDVLPIKGLLRPGETELVTFAYFAYPGVRASATALCHVEGGPTYQVAMTGESNNIRYAVEPQFLDLGQQLYDKQLEAELTIANLGKVPFNYAINTRQLSRPSVIQVSPMAGEVQAGQKEVVHLRVCAGIPERLLETLQVELAHFDPINVQVMVEGTYPAVLLNLPRLPDRAFVECLEAAKSSPSVLTSSALLKGTQNTGGALPRNVSAGSRKGAGSRPPSAQVGGDDARSTVVGGGAPGRARSPGSANARKHREAQVWSAERMLEVEAERRRLAMCNKLAASHYVLDFGHVVKGSAKVVRRFRIYNFGAKPVSFRFDRNVLEAHGLKIPDVTVSQEVLDFGMVLAGHTMVTTLQLHNYRQVPCEWSIRKPIESSRVRKIVKLHHSQCEPSEGTINPGRRLNVRIMFTPAMHREQPYHQVLPLKVTGNPRTHHLICSAKGATPTVHFQPPSVNCGAILPATPTQAPNEARFCMHNPCPFPVEVFSLDFDQQYLADEDILQSLGDERFSDNGAMYLTPLPAGSPLWPELVAEVESKRALERASAEAAAAEGGDGSGGGGGGGSGGVPGAGEGGVGTIESAAGAAAGAAAAAAPGSKPGTPLSGGSKPMTPTGGKASKATAAAAVEKERQEAEAAAAAAAAAQAAEQALPPVPARMLVALYGVQAAGVSTQAALVGQRYGLPTITFDDLLFEGADAPAPPPAPEPLPGEGEAAAPDAPEPKKGSKADKDKEKSEREHQAKLAASQSGREKGGGGKKGEKGEGAAALPPGPPSPEDPAQPWPYDPTISDIMYKHVFIDPDLEKQPDFVPPASNLPEEVLHETLLRALRQALHHTKLFAPGLVLDSLRSRYVPPATALKLLMLAAGMKPIMPPEPEVDPKAKKAPKSKASEPPPPPKLLEAWTGPYHVFVVEVTAERDVVLDRIRERRAVQEAADAATAEREAAEAKSAAELAVALGAAQHAQQQAEQEEAGGEEAEAGAAGDEEVVAHKDAGTPPKGGKRKKEKGQKGHADKGAIQQAPLSPPLSDGGTAEAGDGGTGDEGQEQQGDGTAEAEPSSEEKEAAEAAAAAAAAEAARAQREAELAEATDNAFAAFAAEAAALKEVMGLPSGTVLEDGRTSHPNTLRFLQCCITAGMSPEVALLAVCGIHFKLGVRSSIMPPSKGAKKGGGGGSGGGKGGGGGEKKDKKGGGLILDSVFTMHTQSMDLKVDETQELTVFAFPTEVGPVEDAIVCHIKDNPEPVVFPLSVVGAKPQVHVRRDDGTPGPLTLPPPEAGTPPGTPADKDAPATPGKGGAKEKNKILAEGVVFERLLVGKSDTKEFFITNPGLLPIKWRLAGVDALPKELQVTPTSGVIAARSEIKVAVEFTAIEKREVQHKLTLEVQDIEGEQGVAHSIPIAIKGEAYKIETQIKFPQEGLAGLDYGTMRVCDSKPLPLVFKNTGKYPVSYAFTLRNAQARELFTIEPQQGSVEPNKDAAVQVIFNKSRELQREVLIVNSADITMSTIEPLTSSKEESVPIRVSLRAVFSKYAITPARGINFGPHTYNTTSKPRTFEITNMGDFSFNYRLFNFASPPREKLSTAAPAESKDKKGVKPSPPPAATKPGKTGSGTLVVSQFSMEPAEGTVPPGGVENIGVDISERDVLDNPDGIKYELSGESCIPGIDASALESIFEEHAVSPALDPAGTVPFQLGLRERAFNFGAVIADLTTPPAVERVSSAKGGKGDKKGATADAAAAAALAAAEAAKVDRVEQQGGARAVLKFTNSVKVPSTVNLSIKPRLASADKQASSFPMEVHPSQMIIPPQESRFATVYFTPRALQHYSGILEAVVEGGTDPNTKSFTCEVRGEGVLPSLSLQQPTAFDASGRPCLRFGRVSSGRPATQRINLKNNGLIPASARMEWVPHPSFTLLEGPQPGRAKTYTVRFSPGEDNSSYNHELRVRVTNNPYEDYRIALSGEGFQEDVTFEGLPDDTKTDELRLPDGPLGVPRTAIFTLRNQSSKHYRFRWPPTHPNLSFSPATGHLHAGSSTDITLTFNADAPTKLSPATVKLALAAITYNPPHVDLSGLYTVSPEGGVVEGKSSTTISVRFSPREVQDCARVLVCDIPHLDASCAPLMRALNGHVLRPWAHFELPDNDYIAGGRRDPMMPGPSGVVEPLDPLTKVLEIESLGVRLRNLKRFMVLNPTGIGYDFCWEPMGAASSSPHAAIKCITRQGIIGPGRQFEMVFEYTPQADVPTEAFWVSGNGSSLAAAPPSPPQDPSQPWTRPEPEPAVTEVPGSARELALQVYAVADNVKYECGAAPEGIVFRPTMMFQTRVYSFLLTNLSTARLDFKFQVLSASGSTFALDRSSYEATPEQMALTGGRPVVDFKPSNGTVPPNGTVSIEALFAPYTEQAYNYNVQCKVSNKPSKLHLNVKGEGFVIHEQLQLEGADGRATPLAHGANIVNPVDFGQVIVNERAVRAVALINTGSLAYDFEWDIGLNPRISVNPEKGTVAKGERTMVEISYNPHGPDRLSNYPITCQIVSGHKYVLALSGTGHKPNLSLSFTSHDFGPCALWQPGMPATTKVLKLSNTDTQPISVDPQLEGGMGLDPSSSEPFILDFPSCVLAPGESRDALVTFKPVDTQTYAARLPLEINGLFTLHVDFRGEGTPLRVECANPEQQAISFGSVPKGNSSTRTVGIVNRGRVHTRIKLTKACADALEALGVQWSLPPEGVVLRPREVVELKFFYRPIQRCKPFHQEITADVGGITQPLLRLSGACAGTELRMASDSVPFGPVVLGSRTLKRVTLENTGDLGTKFEWDKQALGEHFSISPATGFLAPGQDVKLDIVFHPQCLSPDLRAERVRCRVGESCSQQGTPASPRPSAAAKQGSTAVERAASRRLAFGSRQGREAAAAAYSPSPSASPARRPSRDEGPLKDRVSAGGVGGRQSPDKAREDARGDRQGRGDSSEGAKDAQGAPGVKRSAPSLAQARVHSRSPGKVSASPSTSAINVTAE
ncbi:hypothetical protein DUNSADRAFT_14652 [Dunaliella salina]|uniref:Uncharacterized protein n=1 Tax=Dunaliella salina TaxID=3046 RepID=A0ABQ7G703_DUNSA|nr:hypothetical protein DUNSADRAFT_14652 [Dunaliella salina]|eukprot:KAF5830389.1 hypothetical protein DUNSADRAFT_14652 [Dunaliella salina]